MEQRFFFAYTFSEVTPFTSPIVLKEKAKLIDSKRKGVKQKYWTTQMMLTNARGPLALIQ